LARDLGRSLKVGGHLSDLRRTGIGPFSVGSAASLGSLVDPQAIRAKLIPPAMALVHFPSFEVGLEEATRIRQGGFIPLPGTEFPEGTLVRVVRKGDLVAMAAKEGDRLQPRKVFADG
jgi:tRNA pseudouridine55 synthase